MNTRKIEDQNKVHGIYGFVLDNARRTAKSIKKVLGDSSIDRGGIIIVHGPLASGKSIVTCELFDSLVVNKKENKFLEDKNAGFFVPDVDRSDITPGLVVSRSGKKCKVDTFKDKKDIERIFSDNDIVVVDDFQFVPYELQSFFVREIMLFVERGGWFVGLGIMYNFERAEFLIGALLLERAYREYNLASLCQMCGKKAYKYGQRLVNGKVAYSSGKEYVPPSEEVSYEPRCDDCLFIK